ncbi:MAG: acyltransferase [Desulfobacterales bacterium]|nr:acyltransferase [Desulfobacterales bacterium]MBF0395571.1 acyltransferase [Desulfobacterales bacterium]
MDNSLAHKIKSSILYFFIIALSFIIKICYQFSYIFKRVYYSACLKASLWEADISVQCDSKVYILGTKKITIGKRCRIGRDTEFETEEYGIIKIGDDVRINRGTTIVSYSKINIGDFAIIGEYVSIRDANHGMKLNMPMRYQPHDSSPIEIGRDVWIGRGSCILGGITIGDGSVIGANSVVTKDIPAYSIAVGSPAKVISKRKD